ncbi:MULTISPECIES: hypothetical protein [Desulfofundulus]|uniref:Uncharacterized protein n=1 Tax=Desulfofundulus australicus DSM 11792 TaxID=1121425 RepID=A0A1M4X4T9_9FIRM|nr:hypothetical protein [Desulfofundulus thermocisternus]SHE88475.1 hypothetical protein SAMN02745218_00992 [Desulfofundulus australicus DSM 11792]
MMVMQLSPGERSILAYFPSSTSARRAMEELKSAGYDTLTLDRVSRFGVEDNAEINYPLAGRADSITGLTLFSTGTGLTESDSRVLRAADPSVSGMAACDYGLAGGSAFLLTVVTGEDRVQEAVEILKKHGARV